MGIKFNPLLFSGLDFAGSSTRISWQDPVATEASLPTSSNQDGDTRVTKDTDKIWVWDATTSRWIDQGITLAAVGNAPNANGASSGTQNVSTNRTTRTLTLQPADATNPGIISTNSQHIPGPKTFDATIYTPAGIDVVATAGADTLTIGALNADVINIGNSGATVNIQGTTLYENVTQLQVTDPIITVNKGGSVGSASASGIELEENATITGYVQTSNDRNSWQIKAPNTSGVATIVPGVTGITLTQSSHDPVTLGTANGLSLSTQQLSLGTSSTSTTGALTNTDWNTFNNKVAGPGTSTDTAIPRFSGATGKIIQNSGVTIDASNNISGIANLNATGTTTLATSLSGPLRAASGVVSTGSTSLTTEVTGTLPIANGGTNSNTTLNNNRVMVSSGSKIVEAAALTNGQLLIGSTGAAPVAAALSPGAGISVTNGAGTITIAQTLAPSVGDIAETSFTAADNQSPAANITGFAFANASVRSFRACVSIARGTTYAHYDIMGIQKTATWEISQTSVGDDTGITFSITNAGQIQYLSTSTGSTALIKFRALTTTV